MSFDKERAPEIDEEREMLLVYLAARLQGGAPLGVVMLACAQQMGLMVGAFMPPARAEHMMDILTRTIRYNMILMNREAGHG
jgi:hypothetical protein